MNRVFSLHHGVCLSRICAHTSGSIRLKQFVDAGHVDLRGSVIKTSATCNPYRSPHTLHMYLRANQQHRLCSPPSYLWGLRSLPECRCLLRIVQ